MDEAVVEALEAGEAGDPNAPATPRLGRVSWSGMSSADICARKFYEEYLTEVPVVREPSGAAIGGIAVHRAMEILTKEWPKVKGTDLYATFHHAFDGLIVEAGAEAIVWGGHDGMENEAWWRQRGPEMLDYGYAVKQLDEANGYAARVVEAKLGFWIDGVYVSGRLDELLVNQDTGMHLLRDYKTGRQNSAPYQLSLYAIGAEELFECTIHWAQFVNLRTMNVNTFSVDPFREVTVRKVQNHLAWQAAMLEAGVPFPMQPSSMCGSCSVWHACEYGTAYMEQKLAGDEEGGT